MQFKIGVFGSASDKAIAKFAEQAYVIGGHIASEGGVVVTGACPGLPHEAARGAANKGGLVIGISPAESLHEHISLYNFPFDDFYNLIFTGFGKKGRNVVSVRTCDAGIYISGQMGTLNEFTIAYDEGGEGFIIGVLEETGGTADFIKDLVRKINKPTRSVIVYDNNPRVLVERIFSFFK